MIREIHTFPQVVLSSGQGKVGFRRWILDPCEDLDDFLNKVCDSRFVKWTDNGLGKGVVDYNTVPVQIQVGPLDEKMLVRNGGDVDDRLMQSNATLVTCQYQFMLIHNCWPTSFGSKPKHFKGSTLSMEIKGSGQFLLVSPTGLAPGGSIANVCTDPSQNTRILVPITEYHITNDRLKQQQLDYILTPIQGRKPFKHLEGRVNRDTFLNEVPGTLLFDTYHLNETFAPDPSDPVRYRLTVVFRARHIWPGKTGDIPDGTIDPPDGPAKASGSPPSRKEAYGWNWDYKLFAEKDKNGNNVAGFGWRYILMKDQLGSNATLMPRYLYSTFCGMFYPLTNQGLDEAETECNQQDCSDGSLGAASSQAGLELDASSSEGP